jgi:hypothetical protein
MLLLENFTMSYNLCRKICLWVSNEGEKDDGSVWLGFSLGHRIQYTLLKIER